MFQSYKLYGIHLDNHRLYICGSGVSRFHSDSARHRYGAYNTHVHMNNPVTSVYSTNLFHGTAGLLLAQSSGILLILHYRFQQVHTCNIKQIQFTIKVQRAAQTLEVELFAC